MSRHALLAWIGLSLILTTYVGAQEKQKQELAQLKQLLPPSPAFDQWLEKFGYLPPDFEALPSVPYPQDLLSLVRDGKAQRVTAAQWPQRRQELRALAEDWLMGHAPPAPGNVRAVIEDKKKEDGKEVWTVRLEFGPDHAAKLHCWLWIPSNLQKPAPVFLVDNQRYTSFALEAFNAGRFLICVYNATDPAYVPEKKDESEAYNDLFGKFDWCEFYRRGWSASRAVDWLTTLDFVAKDKVYIGGHSRSAKQSLAAAAFDERFAGVIASSPGSGGSLPYRFCDQFVYGESAERLTTVFPYWVSPKVRFFAGRENKLPADMHFIYALIAPRQLLMSTAIHDSVENTWVVEQMYQSIQPVWAMLGKPENLAQRYHPGPHTPDAGTLAAHNQFLLAAADGKSGAEAFPFRPLHPWDYAAWAKKNAPAMNLAAMPPRTISDPTRDESGKSIAAGQWPAARSRICAQINWLLGDGPAYQPAQVRIGEGESEAEAKQLTRQNPPPPQRTKCRFGDGINGNFYYPSAAKPAGKLPTVIWLAPLHTSTGYIPGYRIGDIPYLSLSKAGFLVLAFDPIGTANRQEERRDFYDRHPAWSLMGKMVHDARSAIDAALANPDADPKQVYLLGFGMGGMVATLTAALDDRVAGAVSVAGFTPFRTDTAAAGTGGIQRYSHLYGWLPRLGAFVNEEPRVPVDFNEILAAVAPRRMLVVAPTLDWHATHADIALAVEMAGKAYALLGAPNGLHLHSPVRFIEFNNDMQAQVIAWLKPAAAAAKAPEPADEPMEKRVIADADSVRQWSAAECTIEASKARMRTGQPVLRWHVTVDHFAGEPNYPIGWPRVGLTPREAAARDWSGWDYLQMWVYTDTTRDTLPREPAGLAIQAPDKNSAYSRSLGELVKGRWVQIRVPLSELSHPEDVRLLQLHISESNYRHQDQLDFYLDDVSLLRYARPTLLDFAVETAVMFDDAKQLAVRFNLTGLKKPDAAVEVICELHQADRTIARTAVQASRGPQRVVLDLTTTKLTPGEYELIGRATDGTATARVHVRVVESPWKSAE